MSKLVIILFILFYSGCYFLNTPTIKQTSSTTIYANMYLDVDFFGTTKIKTKIKFLKDSIIATAYPFFGMELGSILLTNSEIVINKKFENKSNSILMSTIDPKLKLKSIKKSILQTKSKNDTIRYQNKDFSFLLTDYIYKENIFLPQKIIYLTKSPSNKLEKSNVINIEYRAVKFFADKNE